MNKPKKVVKDLAKSKTCWLLTRYLVKESL